MISKNGNKLSLDNICKLLKATIATDSIGNQIATYVEREVFCAELPVYSSEFYNANQQGIKIQKILVVDTEEYEDETDIRYDSEIYSIFKIFARSDGLLEIYCSEKVGV